MPILSVNLNGDGAWPDLDIKTLIQGEWTRITILPGGMTSGQPSIGILVELPDGAKVFAETSWKLLHAAVKGMEARYGVPA